MFCSKCGKEIMTEAVICPYCGCPTNNYQATSEYARSDDYPAIREFADKAKAIQVFGILAAALMFGIGLIFSIIIWTTASKVTIPEITTTNPAEIKEFELAKRRFQLGKSLAGLPLMGLGLCIGIGFFLGYFMSI